MDCIEINGRKIGPGRPVYIVAELSANHHRSLAEAVRLVEAAREAGADAVKLQTYTPDTMTLDIDSPLFRLGSGPRAGRTLYRLYAEAYTPWEWQPELKRVACALGLDLFSSPFDRTAVDFLEKLGVPAYKIASFELVDTPLIEYVARTGKPVIISTGMGMQEEIKAAVEAMRRAGNGRIALLCCTSAYPASPSEMNLRTIPLLAAAFSLPVGLSDHSLELAIPVAAVALGACIIEKHLTLSRSIPGPDSGFSLEPDEFGQMVRAVRMAEAALGEARFGASPSEAENLRFRRSLFVVEDIAAGELFTDKNIRSIRPAAGLPPGCLGDVLGRKASRFIKKGTPLSWELVE